MLYQVVNFSVNDDNTNVVLNPGHIGISPLPIAIGQGFRLMIVQTTDTEDFSLRAWVSAVAGGPSVVLSPPNLTEWYPGKIANMPVPIAERTHSLAFDHPHAVLVLSAGNYFLNVLNLINFPNSFTLALQQVR